jgi:hypothetical protein
MNKSLAAGLFFVSLFLILGVAGGVEHMDPEADWTDWFWLGVLFVGAACTAQIAVDRLNKD